MTCVSSPYQWLTAPFQTFGLVSKILLFGFCLLSLNLNSQVPCDSECCPNGPQHTFEGSTGDLPPFGTTTNGGWEANQGTPSYETMDGCDGSMTSVELKGFNPLDEVIFTSSGVAGPNIIFEVNKTYCIQLCVKATQLIPDFEVYAGNTAIQVINVASPNWTTVQFYWTATANFTSFSIRNLNFETIGLFDNVCISEATPENGCKADFSVEQFDCGILCLTNESCGEYGSVLWTLNNAASGQTINNDLEDPCFTLAQGIWSIQLQIQCNDGSISTKDTTISIIGLDVPEITCPSDLTIAATQSSPCEVEYIMPMITHSPGTLECYINGNLVAAGTSYLLPEGVNNVYCLLTDECELTAECQYRITVECEMEQLDTLCGEAVISCFSGKTFGTSNPNGYVLGIVHNKDWASAPLGANWTAASSSIYHHSSWTAANLGEIFGLAIDNKDFIYATTTSLYGKNLGGPAGQGGIYKIDPVSGVITNFVSTGPYTINGNTIPNDGAGLGNICYDSDNDQFYVTNFYDGYIYRINTAGVVKNRFEPFPGGTTSSSPTFIELGHRPWGIAYNPIDKRLYFSNWVSIRSVPTNGPTTIHSIDVSSGDFDLLPPQPEITLSKYNPTDMPISDIAVSEDGKLLMSNKAAYSDYAESTHYGALWAHIGAVYEYEKNGTWILTAGHGTNPKYNVGGLGRFDAAGGIDYGYESTGNLSKPQFCDASVWATGDYLHGGLGTSNIYYGLQGMPNTGGYNATSVIIDYDNSVNTYAKASFGDVEIFKCGCFVSDVECDSLMVMSRPLECIDPNLIEDINCIDIWDPVCGCDGETYSNACYAERDGVTVYVPGDCDSVTVPSLDSMCCYMIDLKNNWGSDIVELEAQLLGSEWIYNNVNLYAPFSFGSCGSFNQKFCLKEGSGGPIPGGTTSSAAYVCFTPTVSNPTSDPQIKFTWKELVNETDTIGICMDTLTFECLPKPPLPCLEIINKEAICDPEDPTLYDLCFNVVNNSGVEVCDLTLECIDPGFCFDPFCRINTIETILPSPLADGSTSSQICIKIETLIPITSPQDVCLKAGLVSCDGTECCHDPVKVCFPIEPCCDPCEDRGVTFNSVNIDENECCYSVDITNDCLIDYFVGLRLKVQTPGVCIGTHLMNPIHSPMWTTTLSPTEVTFTPISGFLDQTSYNDLFTFCLDKIENPSQAFPTVVLEWLYVNPITGQIEVACEDPFQTECEPIINDSCLAVIDQELICLKEQNKYQFDFTIINQSKFDACNLHIKVIDPATGYFVIPGSIIPLTSAPLPNGGSESISVCIQGTPFPATASNFIFEYRLQGCDPNDCCRESVQDTIPIPPCDDCCDITEEEFCAQLEDLIAPTNNDTCAPCFDFSQVDSCSSIGVSIDGNPFESPELEESCYTFTSGTHTICFDYKRWKGGFANQDSVCLQKDTCITFVCETPDTTCLACPAGSTPGQDLIINGDFSGGNTGWNSAYTIITNTTSTTSTGEVSVRNSTNLQNPQWCALDHTANLPMGNFLTINGPSLNVAYQTNVTVQPNTDYVFCMWVANLVCSATSSTPIIDIHIDGNPELTGIPIPQINFQWNLITFNWNSGALSGSIPIEVFDTANIQFNDWAIDDVSFVECVQEDLCCEDEEAFYAQLEDIITPTNNDPCAPCFDFSQVDSCSSIGVSIDGNPFESPELEESCYTFTSGTHTICFDYKRWKGGFANQDSVCLQKDTCITFVCETPDTTCLACPAGSTPGQDLIINGDFSGGNTGWNSAYTIITNTTSTTSTGEVSVRNSTNLQNPQWCALDHTANLPMGNFLTINGPSLNVAYQTNVMVQPNTDYVFCMWVANLVCSATSSTPIIDIHIDGNPELTGIPIPQINFQWNLITFNWNSGALSGSIPIEVFDTANIQFNDWAIDDVSFVECVQEDLCCDDEEAFNDLVDLGFEIVSNGNCAVEVCANQFDSCHWFWTVGPDWGDGSIVLPTLIQSDPPNNCWTHTYSSSGVYNICINVEEYGSDGEGCWNRQMCTTIEVECLCEPITDCVEIISTETKDVSCDLDECYVNPLCQTWLRDLLTTSTNNGCQAIVDYYAFHRATWNGQTVFVGYKAGAPDGGSQDIYTCDGTLIQSCTQGVGVICDPDAGIDIGVDLVAFNKFWDCGDILPLIENCGLPAICDDDPWCNLWFRDLVQNTQTNCTGGFIYSFDTGLWGTTPVIIFEGAGPPDYGQNTIYTCDGTIIQDCQHTGGGGFFCSPDAGIDISTDITARTNIWNCGEPIPALDPNCSAGDYTCVTYCTTVRNNTNPVRTIDKIFLSKITGTIAVYPDEFTLNPVLPPNMTAVITYTVCGDLEPGDIVKLNIGLEQTSEEWCCLTDEPLCLEVPPCPCPEVEDICDLLDISASKIDSGDQECCYDININNDYCEDYFKGIVVHLNAPANISSIIANSGWLINQLDPQNAEIYPVGNYIPVGSHTPFTICNNSDSDYNMTLSWLVGLPDGTCEEICPEDLELEKCEGFKCYEFVTDSLDCATNTYCFKIKNVSNPGFDLYSVHLFDLTGSLAFSPIQVNIPSGPLTSGSTSDWICVNYTGVTDGDNVCYKLSAHNQPVGTPPTQCCTDTTEHCFTVEEDCCTPLSCDDLDIGATKISNGDNECCYEINIDNGYCEDYFKGIKVELGNTANISQVIAATGWSINALNNKEAEIFYTGGNIPLGANSPFTICNTSNSDYTISVSWLIPLPDGTCEALCPVDLELEYCLIDPPLSCYEIVEDSLDCTTDTYCFKIRNNSNPGFDIKSIHIYDVTPAGTLSPTGRINVGPISAGMTSDWICYTYSGVNDGDNVCFKVTAHNTPVGEVPTACCTDTIEQCFTVVEDCCTPLSCDDLDIGATKISNGDNECCYEINIDNGYCEDYFKGIKVELGNTANISQVIAATGWSINALNNKEAEIFYTGGNIPLGANNPFTICNTSNSDYTISVSWLIPLPDGTCEALCPVDLELEYCLIDPPLSCYEIVEDSLDCTTDTYCFKIRNNSNPGFDIKSIHIYDVTPAGTLSPTGRINVGPISAGMTSDWICYTYSGVNDGDNVCFKVTAHNTPVGEVPTACCTDTIEQCFTVVEDCCTPLSCDDLDIGATKISNGDNECCYEINIDNGYCEDYFKGIKVELGNTANISQVIAATGWSINALNNKEAEIFYTGGNIPLGANSPFTICNTSNSDYTISVSWLIPLPDGTCEALCPVDLILPPCPPELTDCCVDEDEFCDLVDLGYIMSVDSSMLSVSFNQFDSCHWFTTDGPDWGDGTPVNPGPINASGDHTWTHTYDTTGMYNICISIFEGTSEDSICWEKQICKMLWIVCDHGEANPCEPTQMQVPTGITPNGDNINDVLIIQGPDLCTPIDLYIYNRWGQMVWNQKDYDDTWSGTSYNGEQLPNGTYFMILDYTNVPTQRMANRRFQSYLDIRTE